MRGDALSAFHGIRFMMPCFPSVILDIVMGEGPKYTHSLFELPLLSVERKRIRFRHSHRASVFMLGVFEFGA